MDSFMRCFSSLGISPYSISMSLRLSGSFNCGAHVYALVLWISKLPRLPSHERASYCPVIPLIFGESLSCKLKIGRKKKRSEKKSRGDLHCCVGSSDTGGGTVAGDCI